MYKPNPTIVKPVGPSEASNKEAPAEQKEVSDPEPLLKTSPVGLVAPKKRDPPPFQASETPSYPQASEEPDYKQDQPLKKDIQSEKTKVPVSRSHNPEAYNKGGILEKDSTQNPSGYYYRKAGVPDHFDYDRDRQLFGKQQGKMPGAPEGHYQMSCR